jgi:hypothetical protein
LDEILDLKVALDALREMSQVKLLPNANSILPRNSVCERVAQWGAALSFSYLKEMRQLELLLDAMHIMKVVGRWTWLKPQPRPAPNATSLNACNGASDKVALWEVASSFLRERLQQRRRLGLLKGSRLARSFALCRRPCRKAGLL